MQATLPWIGPTHPCVAGPAGRSFKNMAGYKKRSFLPRVCHKSTTFDLEAPFPKQLFQTSTGNVPYGNNDFNIFYTIPRGWSFLFILVGLSPKTWLETASTNYQFFLNMVCSGPVNFPKHPAHEKTARPIKKQRFLIWPPHTDPAFYQSKHAYACCTCQDLLPSNLLYANFFTGWNLIIGNGHL